MARKKVEYLRGSLFGFVIASALAGVYLGFGVALIFSLGAPLAAAGAPVVKLVMGMAFGIALTLVIFAGSELFTGNNLVGAVGGLSRSISWADVGLINFWSWFGNLIGSLGIAFLIVQSGVIAKAPQSDFLVKAAAIKMTLPAWELFIRGILCNWLICLAVWMTGRTTNDAAKIVLIFWCLFAFIATGFEHSIANQSLLGMALLLPHDAVVSWGGFWYNQFFVVLGNIVGGGLFVGGLYWLASPYRVAGVCADNASRPISAPAVQQG
jgi:nitrite transporter NirC